MKKLLMKYMMVNCREATLLMAKKEEGRLNFMEKLKLFMHTSMCSFCKSFEKQTSKIAKESKHVHAEDNLPFQVIDRIKKLLGEHLH